MKALNYLINQTRQLLLVMILAISSSFVHGQSCSAAFTYVVNSSDSSTYYFHATSTDTTLTFRWDFGDGSSGSWKNASHNYSASGYYTVYLWVNNFDSTCLDYDSVTIYVPQSPCNADFSYTVDTTNGDVHFTNTSTSPSGSSYFWYFGDGGMSTYTNPVHNYAAGTYHVTLFMNDSTPCWDSISKTVTVPNYSVPCDADFSYYVDTLTGDVHFTNTSTSPNGSSYFWYFGDGGMSTYTNPVHNYAAGTYTVTLFMNDSTPCSDTISKVVHVPNYSVPCHADFSYYVDTLTGDVHFTNTSTSPNGSEYFWYFGDGGVSTYTNPVHNFAPGTYRVALFMNDSTPCSDSISKVITVPDFPSHCNADYTYYVDSLTGEVHFTSLSTGDSIMYTWSFGNGTYAYTENPVQYLSSGVHTVCLFIFSIGNGTYCTDSICKTVTVPALPGCHAEFTYTIDNDSPGVVHFHNLSDTGHYYQWSFGNGQYSTSYSPSAYFVPGIYTVCLLVEDSACLDTFCQIITIGSGDTLACNADYIYYVDTLKGTVYFTNTSTNIDSTMYTWSFGDGTYSYEENPVRYFSQGNHTVCLSIFSIGLHNYCTDSICKTIFVPAVDTLCDANFYYFVIGSSQGYFWDASTSTNDSTIYYWDFGDGSYGYGDTVTHNYSPGVYTVCHLIMGNRCSDSICHQIIIYPGCMADFDFALYPDSADGVRRIVLFENNSSGSNLSYTWIFGDSTTSNYDNPVHYYDLNGNYTVCLIISGDSCWDSVCKVVHISSLDSLTGMDALTSFDQLTVYPVPFSDYLNIDLQGHSSEKMNIKIYDILGVLRHDESRQISTGKNQISLNLDKLSKGVYFIELSTHEKVTSLKIIK